MSLRHFLRRREQREIAEMQDIIVSLIYRVLIRRLYYMVELLFGGFINRLDSRRMLMPTMLG